MASFKPIQRKRLPRLKGDPTPDDKYWRNFDVSLPVRECRFLCLSVENILFLQFPVTVKEYGPVQSVCFSRTKPHLFAVTTSAKVRAVSPKFS